jgi:hypothetical protein
MRLVSVRRAAVVAVVPFIFGLLCYCGGGSATALTPPQAPVLYPAHLENAAAPLVTPTYDGSGQATHPGIVQFAKRSHGYEYWMVMTPYPQSDKTKENPSILASHDGQQWEVPAGLANPIALPPSTFLADGDLLYDPASDQLWVYYIEQAIAGVSTRLLRRTSADGVHWSAEQEVLRVPDYEMISPAVQKVGNEFYMWSVNAGSIGGCGKTSTVEFRTSPDGVNWSGAQTVAVTAAPGYHIWHVQVLRVPARNEYWMLQTVIADTTHCADRTELMFATSKDGLAWTTYGKPALSPSTGKGWDNSHIYRSTMLYDSNRNLLQVWYPGRNGTTGVWRIGYAEADHDKFIEWLKN